LWLVRLGAALHRLPHGTAFPAGQDAGDEDHGLLAAGALGQAVLGSWFFVLSSLFGIRHSGFVIAPEGLLHSLQGFFGGGVKWDQRPE